MPKSLIILGASGNAYDVLDIVDAINSVSSTWRIAGFLDDGRPKDSEHLGHRILGKLGDAANFRDCRFINAIGSDQSFRNRMRILASTHLATDRFATLVHPRACVSPRSRLGRGVCVNFGACIAGGVNIMDHVWVGPGCVIGHDSLIEEAAMTAPGAVISGFVHVGRSAYVGAGSLLRQNVRIGNEALVGLGAVVVSDVAAETVVVGNPARRPSAIRSLRPADEESIVI